jgi:hypothetical protein
MSRLGRSQPIQPFSSHGFLGNVPANGVLPPAPVVVERERRRDSAPVAISVNGLYAIQAPVSAIPNPVFVALIDERRRRVGLDPISFSGASKVSSGVGTPGTTPPGPFVIPLDERRRFLAALPTTSSHGYDDVEPPRATVVEGDRRRPRTPDPLQLSGVLAPFLPPFAKPPGPVVVLGEDGRLRRVRSLDPIVLSGALALFVPITAIPIYQLATLGGDPTLSTAGGAPGIVSQGGAPLFATSGGDPVLATAGGRTSIASQGGQPSMATSGGASSLSTTGGDPTISTAGGAPGLATAGGDPTISTIGGTPTISTTGPA